MSRRSEEHPAFYAQESLLRAALGGQSAVNVQLSLAIEGPADVDRLKTAVHGLVERHEALRTRLAGSGDDVVQIVDADAALDVTEVDMSGMAAPRIEAVSALSWERARPFEINGGPLARARLVRCGDGDHLLALTMHHAIVDGWSLGVLRNDLAALYAGEPLSAAIVQPRVVAAEERRADPMRGPAMRYWRGVLETAAPRLALPDGPARAAMWTVPYAQQRTYPSLDAVARKMGTTPSAVLVSAVAAALHAYVPGRVLVGVMLANRTRRHAGTVGMLADHAPVLVDLTDDPTLDELVSTTEAAILDAMDHKVPLGLLADQLRGGEGGPCFDVSVNLAAPRDPLPAPPGLRIITLDVPEAVERMEHGWWLGATTLDVQAGHGAGGGLTLLADGSRLSSAFVEAAGERLFEALRAIDEHPGRRVRSLTGEGGAQ